MRRSRVHNGKDSSRHLRDCRDDVRIGSTPAEIAAHALPNLVVVELHMIGAQIGTYCTRPASLGLAQHSDRRADLSGRTVAALERVVCDERLLERVQVLTICQPLDSDDLDILMRDGEREAAVGTPTIKQDGTGSALTVVAAFLGTSESETFAQQVQERRPGIDEKLMYCSIHLKGDLKFHSSRVSLCTLCRCYVVSRSLIPSAASLWTLP